MFFKPSKLILTFTIISTAGLTACQSTDSKPIIEERPITSTKYNDAQEEQGAIQKFLTNARGNIDGLILEGGIQVSVAPVMAERLKKTAGINDVVLVKGFYENDRVFKAEEITNVNTSRRISAQTSPPPAPAQDDLPNHLAPEGTQSRITKTPGPSHRGLKKLTAEGTVQNRLYGKFGELTGVVLSDGTIVHFRPDVINTMDLNAEMGDKLRASGYGTQNKYGRAIDATEVTRE